MIAAISLALTAAFVAGCGSDSGTQNLPPGTEVPNPTTQARVRVVHAVPGGPRLDFLVNNEEVFDDLAYRTATDYQDFGLRGSTSLRLNVGDTDTTLVNLNQSLGNNQSYTLVALGTENSIQNLLLTDNNAIPAGNNARVRAVHAAQQVGNVDIYVTGAEVDLNTVSPTLSNVAFRAVSNYLTVPSGDYRVRLTAPGSKTQLVDSGIVNLPGGAVRTVFAVGDPAGDEDEDPEVLITDDIAALGLDD